MEHVTYDIEITNIPSSQAETLRGIVTAYMEDTYGPIDASTRSTNDSVSGYYVEVPCGESEDIAKTLVGELVTAGCVAADYTIRVHEAGTDEWDGIVVIWHDGELRRFTADVDGNPVFTANDIAKALSEGGEDGIRNLLATVGVTA